MIFRAAGVTFRLLVSAAIALGVAAAVHTMGAGLGAAQGSGGSPGPLADTCGASQPGVAVDLGDTSPIFPPGQYPVQLPVVSLLGALNDLPNPFEPGEHWGQLPDGRRWGSTAGIATGPDNTI